MPEARQNLRLSVSSDFVNYSKDFLARARELHAAATVVDSHCDTTQRLMDPAWDFAARHEDGHVDIPRIKAGGIGAVVLAVYAPGPLLPGQGPLAARAQLDAIESTIRRHPSELLAARTVSDVRRARESGKTAILIGIEGGYLLDDSLEVLREFHDRGAVYLTLTHGFHTSWADSSGIHEDLSPLHGGLTEFGREVVRELNRMGLMVDVSHVSDDTFRDVIQTSTSPMIASHSSCRTISPHRRNLSDEMIRAIARTGGVVQINFAAAFVDPTFPPMDPKVLDYWATRGGFSASPYARHKTPLSILVDHFEHAINLVGADHVGIGSDFDGVSALPVDMEDCSRLPHLTAELLRRGYGEDELAKVLGGNFLRVMEQCQAQAQNANPSSEHRHGGESALGVRIIRKKTPHLILASASPRRAEILRDLGMEFDVIPSPVQEPAPPDEHQDPAAWAEQISLLKARSVVGVRNKGLILSGDTIAVLGRRIIGKPEDRAHAEAIIRALAGTTHHVITALAVLDAASGRSMVRHSVTKVRMRSLSDQQIAEYLDSNEWQGKAGAYGIQDHGDKFVEGIEGSFTNVVGLPIELLSEMLDQWSTS